MLGIRISGGGFFLAMLLVCTFVVSCFVLLGVSCKLINSVGLQVILMACCVLLFVYMIAVC